MMLAGRDLKAGVAGNDIRELHAELTVLGYAVPAAEQRASSFQAGTDAAVRKFQTEQSLPATGVVDAATAAALSLAIAGSTYIVTGTVSSPVSVGVDGLTVDLVDKNVGGDLLLASGATGADGSFAIKVAITAASLRARRKSQPDLQVRISSGSGFLAASSVRYGAPTALTLDVVLPADAAGLPSEYESLAASVAAAYAGKLDALVENEAQQDITYLANKTGWDARAVAMTALASRFAAIAVQRTPTLASSRTGSGRTSAPNATLKPEFYYALFRAGLAANPDSLFRTGVGMVREVWQQAIANGIIPQKLSGEVDRAAKTFEALSAANLLDGKPEAGLSTLRQMLGGSLPEPARQAQFAALLARQHDDPATLWSDVESAFGSATARKLQLDGQLYFLTGDNADLVTALNRDQGSVPLGSGIDLVTRGYHDAAKWVPLIGESVPSGIPGDNVNEQRLNYASVLAAQVRIAFPTAVMADLVQRGTLPLSESSVQPSDVAGFLMANHGAFEIGVEPIEAFLRRTGVTDTAPAIVAEVKRLQRVYQITPDDHSMSSLMGQGLDSAYAVTRFDETGFVRAFSDALGGAPAVRQIHARAKQVHNAVLNAAMSYLLARQAPVLGGAAPVQVAYSAPTTTTAAVIAYPTLDSLFGSPDLCDCQDCRSVLSPAAYFVDLLNSLDIAAPSPGFQNPQANLFQRRPDLQYLPLTCENTNTALPYIDLVNETLEFFVAHDLSLFGFEGHDTGPAVTSSELLASPQNVDQTAYDVLAGEFFPPPLPFDRPLTLLRLHLAALGVPLQEAMVTLRPSDAIERGSAAYGWRDILIEQLGISRQEYRVFTDSGLKLQGLYGYATLSDADVLATLQEISLQDFSRRTGVSYADLDAIIATRFLNPHAALIPRLQRLNMPFAAFETLKNGLGDPSVVSAFKAALPAGLDARVYGGASADDLEAVVAWVTNPENYARIMAIIVIADTDGAADSCSAAGLRFRYSNPDPGANLLTAADLVKLIRFIRLWRKLGLTVAQTDAILAALYPSADLPNGGGDAADLARLDAGFVVFLPRLGMLMRVAAMLGGSLPSVLLPMLAIWAPIDTTGAGSLYAGMFLSPTLAEPDSAFADDGFGNYLGNPAEPLLAHEATLCAAFNLTGAEFALITGSMVPVSLGFDAGTPLTLANISAIYRIGWLAHALGLSVLEFLRLRQASGLDPFASLDPSPAPPAEPPAIRFIRLVQALSRAGLRPVQALYLLWNEDISGQSAPSEAQLMALAVALRADFASVDAEFALQDDPDGSVAKKLMTLVYGAAATDFFFGLVDATVVTAVACSAAQPVLAQPIRDASAGRLAYDDLRKQLSFAGLLDATTAAAIDQAIGANGDDAALHAALSGLAAASEKAVAPFFAEYPELQPLYSACVAATGSKQERNMALLGGFLPALQEKRKQEQALASVTAMASTDSSFAALLLQDAALIHAADAADLSACADVIGIETPGLAAEFFLGNDASAAPDISIDAASSLDYAPASANELPPGSGGGPIAGQWSGYLDVPQDGFYSISVKADAGASVALEVGGVAVPMAAAGATWSNQAAIRLTAGAPVAIRLTATSLKTTLQVRWQSQGLGWQAIPPAYLYSSTRTRRLRAAYVRFLKATGLASALSLGADEFAWLARSGWLNTLPVSGSADDETAAELGQVLVMLLDFARLKQALSPGDARLLAVMRHPSSVLPDGSLALSSLTGWSKDSIEAVLEHFFGTNALDPLSDVATFARVFDALALVGTVRVSPAALIAGTTNAPSAAAVGSFQSALRSHYAEADWLTVIKPINDALRIAERDALVAYILQRFGDGQAPVIGVAAVDIPAGSTTLSLESADGVLIGMRATGPGLAAGANVAAVAGNAVTLDRATAGDVPAGTQLSFVVDTSGIDTADKLFEYFLIDVETQPPVATSRIRLALSSVQLFIERVLRNLEPQVQPSDLATLAVQWPWMKRYRVWQANREVFLWPENWLYPELRDDKSPLFDQAVGALLQGDINQDSAASTYLDYLTGLEEVAKLEPCGLHFQPAVKGAAGGSGESVYVVARTAGAHRKYYFREQKYGAWSPWTQVKIDCEDGPLTPVVWNGRLFLFWLKVLKQSISQSPSSGSMPGGAIANLDFNQVQSVGQRGIQAQRHVGAQAVLCWCEYYNGKWQPTKTSDISRPTSLGSFDIEGEGAIEAIRNLMRISPVTVAPNNAAIPDDALILAIGSPTQTTSGGFVLYNTHSLPVRFEDIVSFHRVGHIVRRTTLNASVATPASGRSLSPMQPYTGGSTQATFGITYWTSDGGSPATHGGTRTTRFTNQLIGIDWLPRYAEPQLGLDNAWDAPFFYEDRQHLFYVTTTEAVHTIRTFDGFGTVFGNAGVLAAQAPPPLVIRPPAVAVAPEAAPLAVGSVIGGGSPAASLGLLSMTATLRAALGDADPVTYQGRQIYPTGSADTAAVGEGEA